MSGSRGKDKSANTSNRPFLEVLVDGQELGTLIGLDVVPGSRVLLGPDDCSSRSA